MPAMRTFLLIGQSNMAGRGVLGSVPPLRHDRVFMFRSGRWLPAEEPLHTDKPELAGIGLGMSFAVALADADPVADIGLVPCAMGGTSLDQWAPGGVLYNAAVNATRAALAAAPGARLAGILWHQGEADAADALTAGSYDRRLAAMLGRLRGDLGRTDAPVVAGTLGGFLARRTDTPHAAAVTEGLRRLARTQTGFALAEAGDLTDGGDLLHFDAPALRILGRRYAEAFRSMGR